MKKRKFYFINKHGIPSIWYYKRRKYYHTQAFIELENCFDRSIIDNVTLRFLRVKYRTIQVEEIKFLFKDVG